MDYLISSILKTSAREIIFEKLDDIYDIEFLKKGLKEHLRKEFNLEDQLEEINNKINEFRLYLVKVFNSKENNLQYIGIIVTFEKMFKEILKGSGK